MPCRPRLQEKHLKLHHCGVLWCKISAANPMPKARSIGKPRIGAEDVTRASVSFPAGVYAALERIAAAKRVSIAWVVREATERYVADHAKPSVALPREGK